jgi:tRNA(fMet)-specific endonuclease VapC
MVILIDADVIIEAERGRFPLDQWMVSRPEDDFQCAAITIAEMWHGVERATAQYKRQRQLFLEALFSVLTPIEYTASTAREHARIWAQQERKGTMSGAHDLILAATALEHDAVVATFNKKHFSAIPGLKLLVP